MRFNDGMNFAESVPDRTVRKSDGLYVVGEGWMIPVNDHEEARSIIDDFKKADEEGK